MIYEFLAIGAAITAEATLSELARANGLRLTSIKNDAGEEAALIEAMDETAEHAQELEQALAAGRVQAGMGGVPC